MEMHRTEKEIKALGKDTLEEMEAMTDTELKQVIVDANTAMKQVKEELESNEKYIDLKQRLADVTQGKKDVDKRQKARIAYSLRSLEARGKLGAVDLIVFERELEKKRRALFEKKLNAEQAKREKDIAETASQEEQAGR